MTDVPIGAPEEALRAFRSKGFTESFSWQDVWQDEHARSFTVAKAMQRDVLETIRASVDAAIADGTTLEAFKRDLQPKLEELGWWGRKSMIDPLTGKSRVVQLGSPRRLRTIFETNMRVSYQAGRWDRIERQKKAFPLLMYMAVMDGRERPQHRAWHGTVLPVDHPWWNTHYGPCGWGCRCTAVAYNARTLAKRGLAVTDVPPANPSRTWVNKRTGEIHEIEDGIDPGWSYNVGKANLSAISPPPLPPAPPPVVPPVAPPIAPPAASPAIPAARSPAAVPDVSPPLAAPRPTSVPPRPAAPVASPPPLPPRAPSAARDVTPPPIAGPTPGRVVAPAARKPSKVTPAEAAKGVAPFFRAFGLTPATARAGKVVLDKAKWPLAVSIAMFEVEGAVVLPAAATVPLLRLAGTTLTDPDEIWWVWTTAADGSAVLTRRYVTIAGDGRAECVVDVGRDGWRFRTRTDDADLDRARRGRLVWSRELGATAAFNPHQPRWGKGGAQGGRFQSTGGADMRASLSSDQRVTRKASIGLVSPSTATLIGKLGIDAAGRRVAIDHSFAMKILNKHGIGNEKDRQQTGVSTGDLFRASKWLNMSRDISADPRQRTGRQNQPRFEARTKVGKHTINMVFQVNPKDVTLVTLFKRRD